MSGILKSLLKDITFSNLKIRFACIAADITSGEQVVLRDGSLVESIRASISIPMLFTPVKIENRFLVDGGLVNVVPISVCRDMGADYVVGVNVIPSPSEAVSLQEAYETYYSISKQQKDENHPATRIKRKFDQYRSGLTNLKGNFINLFQYSQGRQKQTRNLTNTQITNPQHMFVREPRFSEVVNQSLSIVEYRIAMENLRDANLAVTPFGGNIGFWQFNRIADAVRAGEIAARLALQRDDIARIMLDKYNKNI